MNTYAQEQGLILSNSEGNIMVQDLTDYRYVQKLYENQKGQIKTLNAIVIKQDSTIANLNKVVTLHDQAFTDLFEDNAKKQGELEKKDKKIKNKNKTIAGLVVLQVIEIAGLILLIAL